MNKPLGIVAVSLVALAMCSCVPQAEYEKARAEAEAARAEAERSRAELEEYKARFAAFDRARDEERKARQEEEDAKQKARALEDEMRKRWNAIPAAGAMVPLPVVKMANFNWAGANAFPHPTFRGGSKEAYTAFAKVLVEFLETGDNFEFMQKNDLFKAPFGFGGTGKITFVEFGGQLAQPNSLGAGDEPTRKKLEALVEKMTKPRKL